MVPNLGECSSMGASTVSNMWTFWGMPWFNMQGQRFRKKLCWSMPMLLATLRITHVVSSLKSRLSSCPGQKARRIWTHQTHVVPNGGVHPWHSQLNYQSDSAAIGCLTSLGFCDPGKYPTPGRRHAPSCDGTVAHAWGPHSIFSILRGVHGTAVHRPTNCQFLEFSIDCIITANWNWVMCLLIFLLLLWFHTFSYKYPHMIYMQNINANF